MRLTSFSVQRYRSISEAQRLPLGDQTVLIGPNNEGKSNILRALVLGMQVLASLRHSGRRFERPSGVLSFRIPPWQDGFDWERDFPKALQGEPSEKRTILDYRFELEEDELAEFSREVGSSLNGLLPIRLMLDRSGLVEFKVSKQGRGQAALSRKAPAIAGFISERIRVEYIPSIRTAEQAEGVVRRMISAELAELERSDEFKQAVETISVLQRPLTDAVARTIEESLQLFLPNVRSVEIDLSVESLFRALRTAPRVIVDDGTATELSMKGDGVQSLAAVSLLHRSSLTGARRRVLVLCVEEPEAHLHPDSIHQLRAVLQEISDQQQVILTTHSPLLVNRHQIASNLIVVGNRATPARTLREIREVLGVRISDNMADAALVLLVEGMTDEISLRALLAASSEPLRRALAGGLLGLDYLSGVSGLASRLHELRNSIVGFHVFVDHDGPAREAVERANQEGLLPPNHQTLAIVPGRRESELEDMFDVGLYEQLLRDRWNVALGGAFRSGSSKWTSRLSAAFRDAGQLWSSNVEKQVKAAVAELVASVPESALHDEQRSAFDTLVQALERRLSN